MRALFYLEPVVFRSRPLLLAPWVGWMSQMMRQAAATDLAFASSPWLCQQMREALRDDPGCTLFEMSPRCLLQPFGFDRHAYGRDLYRPSDAETANGPLIEYLTTIGRSFRPDIVVAQSQNRYIELLFPNQATLFVEISPLPRRPGARSVFMDPSSHQTSSLLNLHKDRILSSQVSASDASWMQHVWTTRVGDAYDADPATAAIDEWLETIRDDRKIVALALQPPDWLTFEAAWEEMPVDALLMRWLSEMPSDWLAVPLYHPGFRLVGSSEKAIAAEFQNVRFAPQSLSFGLGELFLSRVDAVATISSSLGMQGLLQGCRLVSYGQSPFSAFGSYGLAAVNGTAALPQAARLALLAFLSNRYCHSLRDCLHRPGYMAEVFREALSPGCADEYFDLSSWTPGKLDALLTPYSALAEAG